MRNCGSVSPKHHLLKFSEQKRKSHRDFEACNPALLELLTTCLRGFLHNTLSHIFFHKQMKKNVVVAFSRRKRQKSKIPIPSTFGHISTNATTSLRTNAHTLVLPVSLWIQYKPNGKYQMFFDSIVETESCFLNPKVIIPKSFATI